jgi:hypothetical protein
VLEGVPFDKTKHLPPLGQESFSTTVESYAKPEANQTGAR